MIDAVHAEIGHRRGAALIFLGLEFARTGAGEERAVVRDHKIMVANQMKITLSTDHRAVDGALGAEFLGAIRHYIESPTAMLV